MSLTKNNLDKSIQLRCHKCGILLLQKNLSNYFPKHEGYSIYNDCYKYEGTCCNTLHVIEITCLNVENNPKSDSLGPPSSFKSEGMEGRIIYMSHCRKHMVYLITDSDLDSGEKEGRYTVVHINQQYSSVERDIGILGFLNRLCSFMFLVSFYHCPMIFEIVTKTTKCFLRLIEMMFFMTLFFILINELLLMARNSDLNTNKPIEPIFNTSIVPYLNSIGEEIGTKLDGIKEHTPLEFLFRETKKETLPFPLPTCFTIPPWSEDVYELGYSGLEKCCFADDEECRNKGELGLCLVNTRIYHGDEPIFRNARKGECKFGKVNGKGGKGFRNLKI